MYLDKTREKLKDKKTLKLCKTSISKTGVVGGSFHEYEISIPSKLELSLKCFYTQEKSPLPKKNVGGAPAGLTLSPYIRCCHVLIPFNSQNSLAGNIQSLSFILNNNS